jgi:4-methyl-5(b-hydroxyethyl)-thiazole monophosphate biosynthesis
MVYILLAEGFEDMEAICPYDVLHRGGVPTAYVGISGAEVSGSHGTRIKVDVLPEQLQFSAEDYIVIPGGLRGVEGLEQSAIASKTILAAAETGCCLCVICAGPRVLYKLGLIKEHQYTCYPGVNQEITTGTYIDAPVVEDGGMITGRAPGSAIDFGLAILAHIQGKEAAAQVQSGLIYG